MIQPCAWGRATGVMLAPMAAARPNPIASPNPQETVADCASDPPVPAAAALALDRKYPVATATAEALPMALAGLIFFLALS